MNPTIYFLICMILPSLILQFARTNLTTAIMIDSNNASNSGSRSRDGRRLAAKKTAVVAASDIQSLTQRALDVLEERVAAAPSSSAAASGDSDDNDRRRQRQQVYIALVGAPGSGKSTIAQNVVEALNEYQNDPHFSVVIPMDGYHIPQAELKKMVGKLGSTFIDGGDDIEATTSGETTMTFDDLMKRRGAPWSFDPKSLYRDLESAREKGEGCFPLYDRSISDPVPDQISVTKEHRIIFCEGNYLIAFDDPDWKPLEKFWDARWLIDVPEAELKERLVKRHLKNWNSVKVQRFGEGRKGAEAKTEFIDLKNARWVYQMSREHADFIINNN